MSELSPAEKAWEIQKEKFWCGEMTGWGTEAVYENLYFAGFSAGEKHQQSKTCEWKEDFSFASRTKWWETSCGRLTPRTTLSPEPKLCPFCGGKIVEVKRCLT